MQNTNISLTFEIKQSTLKKKKNLVKVDTSYNLPLTFSHRGMGVYLLPTTRPTFPNTSFSKNFEFRKICYSVLIYLHTI